MESRIEHLETQVAYQEHAIEKLNEMLNHQQLQMQELEKKVMFLRDQVKANMTDGSNINAPGQEPPPPHY